MTAYNCTTNRAVAKLISCRAVHHPHPRSRAKRQTSATRRPALFPAAVQVLAPCSSVVPSPYDQVSLKGSRDPTSNSRARISTPREIITEHDSMPLRQCRHGEVRQRSLHIPPRNTVPLKQSFNSSPRFLARFFCRAPPQDVTLIPIPTGAYKTSPKLTTIFVQSIVERSRLPC